MWQQLTIKHFFNTLERIRFGKLSITTPDQKRHDFGGYAPGAESHVTITDWRAIGLVAAKGDIGLALSYRDGWWTSDNLLGLFTIGLDNQAILDRYIYGHYLSRLATRCLYALTRNTLKGSQRNIHAHYDLSNEFYRLWLDPGMSYSSAIFNSKNDTLEQAQNNKYDRALDRLGSNSGHLLEIGCGWGGLAERATTKHGFDVKGITLSREQHTYASERLGDKAHIALEDYRYQKGTYDAIISIEMFEAVGEAFWPVYFQKIQSLLTRKGKALIQAITIDENYFERYRTSGDMIRSFIFPGGMLPSFERFRQESERAGLKVTDAFAFGQDYARTLDLWWQNFEHKIPDIIQLGFDRPFIRLWRFYLTYCMASFKSGRTNVMQLELQHA